MKVGRPILFYALSIFGIFRVVSHNFGKRQVKESLSC